MALVGEGVQPAGQAVAAIGRKRRVARSARAGVTIQSWLTRNSCGNARAGLRVRAQRLACSTFPRVVVRLVTAGLSSANRSSGWAQAGTGFVGFVGFAGFAACIAWSARGAWGRGAKAPGNALKGTEESLARGVI